MDHDDALSYLTPSPLLVLSPQSVQAEEYTIVKCFLGSLISGDVSRIVKSSEKLQGQITRLEAAAKVSRMSEPNSRRQLALVTGATGGIGKATALAFAKTGLYNLALHYCSASTEARAQLLGEIKAVSPTDTSIETAFFQADLSSFDEVRRLHAKVVEKSGEVDILFNNAGSTVSHSGIKSLSDVPIDIFEQSWRINTGSGILLTQLCLPYMERTGYGRVIFCSSVAGLTGGVVGPHYASSKSAVHGFVHWLAGNVAKKGITVNAIAPALIEETAMLPAGSEELAASEFVEVEAVGVADWCVGVPVGRLGKPDEIADTVTWMVRNGYVTNKVIAVDGGMYPS
ncbi:hypothetical protein LTR95_001860 [Oleoguttula sp. CCFEE 5521]